MTPKAKYGDESVYFDLNDPEATTGSWDVYGQESTARLLIEKRAMAPDDARAFVDSLLSRYDM